VTSSVKDARSAIELFMDVATTVLDGLELLEAGEKPVEVVRRTLNRARNRKKAKRQLKTFMNRKSPRP
jgi:hypothetical protein